VRLRVSVWMGLLMWTHMYTLLWWFTLWGGVYECVLEGKLVVVL
jgi:hypothetical protein